MLNVYIYNHAHFFLHSQIFFSSSCVHVYRHLRDANTCMKWSPVIQNEPCGTHINLSYVTDQTCAQHVLLLRPQFPVHRSHFLVPTLKQFIQNRFLHSYETAHVSFDENKHRNMLAQVIMTKCYLRTIANVKNSKTTTLYRSFFKFFCYLETLRTART